MDPIQSEDVIDLSRRSLKQIERTWREDDDLESLILDENELSGLESIGPVASLKSLSAAKNRIRRMSSLPQLLNLCSLDLSNNSIVCIEGLKNLKTLKHLNLSGNYIKMIDHLSNNLELEYLDLSDNAIGHITDLSYLVKLKELFLHKNHLSHLRNCEKNLPSSLEVLTLSDNSIADLAEVSRLENMTNLRELTIHGNPCLDMAQGKPGFNYRPYLKIWCLNLSIVDGVPLDPIESLKSEWMYSQGRGRRFRPGEHSALVDYLTTVCPITEKSLNGEEEKKLRLILSKAEQHQQQLREQVASGVSPAISRRYKGVPERMVSSYHDAVSRDSVCASPDVMTRSLDCSVLRNSPPAGRKSPAQVGVMCGNPLQTATTLVPVPESLISPDVCRPLHPYITQPPNRNTRSPLTTCNRTGSPQMTPTSRRRAQHCGSPSPARRGPSPSGSPKSTPTKSVLTRRTREVPSTDNEDTQISPHKLHNIQARASQKRHTEAREQPSSNRVPTGKSSSEKKAKVTTSPAKSPYVPGSDVWKAALCIQRRWRGYRARNLDPKVVDACKTIQANRMQDYIVWVGAMRILKQHFHVPMRSIEVLLRKCAGFFSFWRQAEGMSTIETSLATAFYMLKVAEDMEATKAALEGNRKLQVLQMQAINAMWRKLSSNETDGLTASCLHLTKQVEELRGLVSSLQAGSHPSHPAVPIATQTDIIAVHTPQGENTFPHLPGRPSHLALTDHSETETQENTSKAEVDVCWTPACQEGKDLQALNASVSSD